MILKKNISFRNLFLGRVLSVLADSIMFFSLLKWIEIQSNASGAYTFFFIAYYLPVTLFSLPIGAWIGDKTLQKVMGVANAIRGVALIIFLVGMPYITYHWRICC